MNDILERIGKIRRNELDYFIIDKEGRCITENIDFSSVLVLSGSFNPLHQGHKELANVAEKSLGKTVYFELSISNSGKGVITDDEVLNRVNQFRSIGVIIISNASLFLSKSYLYPGTTFIIGCDLFEMINKNSFYTSYKYKNQDVTKVLKHNGCTFIVAGRYYEGKYHELSQFHNYDKEIFQPLSENSFRIDISSSDIRRKETELLFSVSRRIQRSHSILKFLEESVSVKLTVSDISLFVCISEYILDNQLDYLADVIHDLWCAKYMKNDVESFHEKITQLQVEEELQSNFLKKYFYFNDKEKQFEKELIINDFTLIITRLKELFNTEIQSEDFSIYKISDFELMNVIRKIILSKEILMSIVNDVNETWFKSLSNFYPEDDRVTSSKREKIISNLERDKCLEGLYIDLTGLYLTIMETRYNWSM